MPENGQTTTRYFTLHRPEAQRPVLVEIPHAGLAIPEDLGQELRAPIDCILRDADIYVDKLYADAPSRGASKLEAHVSRYVVDLNRAPHDVDLQTVPDHPAPRGVQPRGVVWRTTTDGRPLYRRPLTYRQLQARLARFHQPYHEALRDELSRLREHFGFAICLAAHSMPSHGRTLGSDRVTRRPDVVPGTRGGTSAHPRLIELIDAHFSAAGLSVRHDDPYRGGYTTAHYGRPRDGWHVAQIELSRGLYVNETTGEPKQAAFDELRRLLADLVTEVGKLEL